MGAHDKEDGPEASRTLVRIGLRLAFCGFLTVSVQVLFWLAQDNWTPFNVRDILLALGGWRAVVPWSGAQAILDWTMAFPLGAWAILIGSAIALIGAKSPPAASETARAR